MNGSVPRIVPVSPDTHESEVSPGVSRTSLVLAIADRRKEASHESIGLEAEFIEAIEGLEELSGTIHAGQLQGRK